MICLTFHMQQYFALLSQFSVSTEKYYFQDVEVCANPLSCLLQWCQGRRSSMLKMLPSVIWCLLYFILSPGRWARLSCGQMIHFRCLPSLCQSQALAWSNCPSGCFLVAFGRLCSRCGFCGCFHQAVWSLSEARACQMKLFESVPVLFLGR